MKLFALPTAAVCLSALLALTASAGTVDVELHGKDKVSGTLRPAGDVECFRCQMLEGTKFVAAVKSKTKGGPPITLSLALQGDAVEGATFAPKGTGGKMTYLVEEFGTYVLCVQGDGVLDGDYDLVVSWKPKTSVTVPGGPTPQDGDDFFSFSGPAGAVATIDVVKAAGSPFKANLVDVEDVDGGVVADLTDVGGSHAVVRLPSTGEFSVGFTNIGDEGEWIGKVKLKVAKPRPAKVDIRDSSLGGAFKSDNTVVGSVLGPDGGTLEVDTGGGSPLDGTTIQIPANSLGGPTVITIAATGNFNSGDGVHAAGPAVDFGPSGTVFDPDSTPPDHTKQAKITIPFDPAYFPGGDTTNLVIYVRNADGTVSEIPGPYQFTTNSVSFFTSHLSSYQPGTRNARPFEGDFIAIETHGELSTNYEGKFGFGFHFVTANDGVADVFNSDADISWLDFGPEGSVGDGIEDFGSQTLDITVPDDGNVDLFDNSVAPPEGVSLRRGRGDDVLVGKKQPIVFLRRAPGRASRSGIAGQWNLYGMEFRAQNNTASVPSDVELRFRTETSTLTFGVDGKLATNGFRKVSSQSNFPAGTWSSETKNEAAQSGIDWFISEGGGVFIQPGEDPGFEMFPVLGGDVMVGRQVNFGGNPGIGVGGQGFQLKEGENEESVELMVMVRKQTRFSKSAAAGSYATTQLNTLAVDRNGAGSQGVEFTVSDVVAAIAANGNVTLTGTEFSQFHDSEGSPTTSAEAPVTGTAKLTFKSDGSFTGPDGNVGALSGGNKLFVRLQSKPGSFEFSFGLPIDE